MVEPASMAGGAGLAKLLKTVLERLATGGKAEVRSLKALADRKFSEIEATHKLFVESLTKLRNGASDCLSKFEGESDFKKAVADFENVQDAVLQECDETTEQRREKFEEAHVYGRFRFVEKGLLKKVPDDIADQLTAFMRVYCTYFIQDGSYRHGLRENLDQATMTVYCLKKVITSKKQEQERDLGDGIAELQSLIIGTELWIEFSRQMWRAIAEEYHKLNKCFREHGLI